MRWLGIHEPGGRFVPPAPGGGFAPAVLIFVAMCAALALSTVMS